MSVLLELISSRSVPGHTLSPTRHVIKKYKNSYGDVVKIYNTDEERTLDEVYNEYFMYRDIVDMLDIAQEKKIAEEKRTDEFLKRIYGDTTYD